MEYIPKQPVLPVPERIPWRPLTIGILLAGVTAAQITNTRVLGVTNTQAIIAYTAPSAAACTLEVSESSTYSPVVNDVDPTKFANANQDSRAGSVSSERSRVFVVGARVAPAGTDGKRYSRALAVLTLHYFRIICGGDTATGTFTTANLALGNTYPEPLPAASPGVWGHPSLDWSSTNAFVIDPSTGVKYKPFPFAQRDTSQNTTNTVVTTPVTETGTTWTGENNVSGATDDSVVASYSGSARDWLWARLEQPTALTLGAFSYGQLQDYLDALTVTFRARVVTGTGEAAKVEFCLSLDGVTCYSAMKELELSTTLTTYTLGTSTPVMEYWRNGAVIPSIVNAARYRGRVSTAGTVVTWQPLGHGVETTSLARFSLDWAGGTGAGSYINIGNGAGTDFRVASIQNPKQLTLTASAGTLTDVNYEAKSFGLIVRKKTTSADVVEIDRISYNLFISKGGAAGAFGGYEVCSATTITRASDSQIGHHCVTGDYSGAAYLWFVGRDTGDIAYLGLLTHSKSGTDGWGVSFCSSTMVFDSGNANVMYCLTADNGAPSRTIVVKLVYTGPNTTIAGWEIPAADMPEAQRVNLTPASTGHDLESLIQSFDGRYDPARYGCGLGAAPRHGNRIMLECKQAGQSTLGYTLLLDPASVAGVGNNTIKAVSPSWKNYPQRACVLHSAISSADGGEHLLLGYNSPPGGTCCGCGIYKTELTASSSFEATPLVTCPANNLGISGVNCSTVTVTGDIYDPDGGVGCTPVETAGARGAASPIGATEINDIFQVDSEHVQLLAKSGNSWTFARARFTSTAVSHVVSSVLTMQCGSDPHSVSQGGAVLWDTVNDPLALNANLTTVLPFGASHGDITSNRFLGTVGDTTLVPGSYGFNYCSGTGIIDCWNVFTGTGVDKVQQFRTGTPTFKLSPWPTFAGQGNLGGVFDDHPSARHITGGVTGPDWMAGSINFGPTADMFSTPTRVIAGQPLYKQTHNLFRKQLGTHAYCGDRVLQDISPAQITETAGDAYKYCVAHRAGDCRGGSVAGEIFFNCPNLPDEPPLTCNMGNLAVWLENGTNLILRGCIFGGHPSADTLHQRGVWGNDLSGQISRTLLRTIWARGRSYEGNGGAFGAQSFALGRWIVAPGFWQDSARQESLLVKVPFYPPTVSIVRNNFVPVTVSLSPPAGLSIDNTMIEFGYNASFECTSRAEVCVKGSQTGSGYNFADDTGWSGQPCAAGCTISIPSIPQRMLYYRWKYRNAANAAVATGGTQVVAVN